MTGTDTYSDGMTMAAAPRGGEVEAEVSGPEIEGRVHACPSGAGCTSAERPFGPS